MAQQSAARRSSLCGGQDLPPVPQTTSAQRSLGLASVLLLCSLASDMFKIAGMAIYSRARCACEVLMHTCFGQCTFSKCADLLYASTPAAYAGLQLHVVLGAYGLSIRATERCCSLSKG